MSALLRIEKQTKKFKNSKKKKSYSILNFIHIKIFFVPHSHRLEAIGEIQTWKHLHSDGRFLRCGFFYHFAGEKYTL